MKKFFFLVSVAALAVFWTPQGTQAQTVADLQAQIQSLLNTIAQLQTQVTQLQGQPQEWCYTFNNNLRFGSSGAQVEALQTALQKAGFSLPSDGQFGESTASAVVGFQQQYRQEVLAPFGLQFGTGFVGTTTRAKLNSLYGCGAVQPPASIPIPAPAPPVKQTNLQCTGLEMTWSGVGRRDPYTFSGDTCNGYRCLVGNEISPACYNDQQCTQICSGSCINILSAKTQCTTSPTLPSPAPSIIVLSPNGGEQWNFGTPQTITWNSSGISQVVLYLWFPDGGTCKLAEKVSAEAGKYIVTIQENQKCLNLPRTITPGQYKISLWSTDNPSLEIAAPHDSSDGFFNVGSVSSIPAVCPHPLLSTKDEVIGQLQTLQGLVQQVQNQKENSSDPAIKKDLEMQLQVLLRQIAMFQEWVAVDCWAYMNR